MASPITTASFLAPPSSSDHKPELPSSHARPLIRPLVEWVMHRTNPWGRNTSCEVASYEPTKRTFFLVTSQTPLRDSRKVSWKAIAPHIAAHLGYLLLRFKFTFQEEASSIKSQDPSKDSPLTSSTLEQPWHCVEGADFQDAKIHEPLLSPWNTWDPPLNPQQRALVKDHPYLQDLIQGRLELPYEEATGSAAFILAYQDIGQVWLASPPQRAKELAPLAHFWKLDATHETTIVQGLRVHRGTMHGDALLGAINFLIDTLKPEQTLSHDDVGYVLLAHRRGSSYCFLQYWSFDERRAFFECGPFKNAQSRALFFEIWQDLISEDFLNAPKMINAAARLHQKIFQGKGSHLARLTLLKASPLLRQLIAGGDFALERLAITPEAAERMLTFSMNHGDITSRLLGGQVTSKTLCKTLQYLSELSSCQLTALMELMEPYWKSYPQGLILSMMNQLAQGLNERALLSHQDVEHLLWAYQSSRHLPKWSFEQRRAFFGCGAFEDEASRATFFALFNDDHLLISPVLAIKAARLIHGLIFQGDQEDAQRLHLTSSYPCLIKLFFFDLSLPTTKIVHYFKIILPAFQRRPDILPAIAAYYRQPPGYWRNQLQPLTLAAYYFDRWPREQERLLHYAKILFHFASWKPEDPQARMTAATLHDIFSALPTGALAALPCIEKAKVWMQLMAREVLAGDREESVTHLAAEVSSLMLAHSPPPFDIFTRVYQRHRPSLSELRQLLAPPYSYWTNRLHTFEATRRLAPATPNHGDHSASHPSTKAYVDQAIERLKKRYQEQGLTHSPKQAIASLRAMYRELGSQTYLDLGTIKPYLSRGEVTVLDYCFEHHLNFSHLLKQRLDQLVVLVEQALNDPVAPAQYHGKESLTLAELNHLRATWFREALIRSALAYSDYHAQLQVIEEEQEMIENSPAAAEQWLATLKLHSNPSCADGILNRLIAALTGLHPDVTIIESDEISTLLELLQHTSSSQQQGLRTLMQSNPSYRAMLDFLYAIAPTQLIQLDERRLRETLWAYVELYLS